MTVFVNYWTDFRIQEMVGFFKSGLVLELMWRFSQKTSDHTETSRSTGLQPTGDWRGISELVGDLDFHPNF